MFPWHSLNHYHLSSQSRKVNSSQFSYKHAVMNPVLVTLFLTSFSSPILLVLLLLLFAPINHEDLIKQSKESAEFGFLFRLT